MQAIATRDQHFRGGATEDCWRMEHGCSGEGPVHQPARREEVAGDCGGAALDGRATEVVEIAKAGTWLNVVSTVETPDGGARQSTQVAPAFHLAGAPVDHEHVRRIDPWPRLADAETFPEA